MLVKHRRTRKLYKVLGSYYDGNRGLLYRLVSENAKLGEKYFYDLQRNYIIMRKKRGE